MLGLTLFTAPVQSQGELARSTGEHLSPKSICGTKSYIAEMAHIDIHIELAVASSHRVYIYSFHLPVCVLHAVVTVTWNGSIITGPVLIYHDEILDDEGPQYTIGNPDRPGALMCRSERDGIASWRLANGNFFNDVNNRADNSLGLQQIRTNSNTFPSLSRLSRVPENRNTSAENLNGLWSCRTDIPDLRSVYVGLYYRTEGKLVHAWM